MGFIVSDQIITSMQSMHGMFWRPIIAELYSDVWTLPHKQASRLLSTSLRYMAKQKMAPTSVVRQIQCCFMIGEAGMMNEAGVQVPPSAEATVYAVPNLGLLYAAAVSAFVCITTQLLGHLSLTLHDAMFPQKLCRPF